MRNIVATAVVGIMITASGMFGADLRLGNWKFNAAKSKIVGASQIKSQTDAVEAAPDGKITVTRTGQFADGAAYKYSFSYKYDGREYPVKGAPFDVIAVKRVDMYTTKFELSKSGSKYTMKGQTVISADAQTRTITSQGTDAAGKPVTQTLVFNRF